MNITIIKEILQKTTKCDRDFECLNNDCRNQCKIDRCVNNVIFLKNGTKNNCNYKLSFSEEKICMCPTRKEIYDPINGSLFLRTAWCDGLTLRRICSVQSLFVGHVNTPIMGSYS